MTESNAGWYDTSKDKVFAPEHTLLETENFLVSADDHPLVEGHLLIIPKENISCVGEFPPKLLDEFTNLYDQTRNFVKETYGKVSTFEHGRIGQTIYHAHVHVLPFEGTLQDIVPEGEEAMMRVDSISDVGEAFAKEGRYLFVSVGDEKRLVDPQLGYPRFFRDRFADALGKSGAGDWQKTKNDIAIREQSGTMIKNLERKWLSFKK